MKYEWRKEKRLQITWACPLILASREGEGWDCWRIAAINVDSLVLVFAPLGKGEGLAAGLGDPQMRYHYAAPPLSIDQEYSSSIFHLIVHLSQDT